MNKFCHIVTMRFVPPDPRHDAILNAAWDAMSSYGYRKTSMDDIAKGAGMSRPALYIHFKNKEAICRALISSYFYNAICDVHEALQVSAPLAEKLQSAFEAQGGAVMKSIVGSQHGHEMLEIGNATSADIIVDGETELHGVYARWLKAEAEAGTITLPATADQVARSVMASLHGIKRGLDDYQAYCEQVRVLAKMTAAALSN